MSLELEIDKISALRDRAHMLQQARSFFSLRDVIEIDCPILNKCPNIDSNIDPIAVNYFDGEEGFLHTSPEWFLKKMLSQKIGDIYFLGHVFRDHEKGAQHNVEFTMVEWYRQIPYEAMIAETCDFIQLFYDVKEIKSYSYREIFFEYTAIDYPKVSEKELIDFIDQNLSINFDISKMSKSDLLILIFTHHIELKIANEELVVINNFPKEQAALSKLAVQDGLEIAKRFEIYSKGIELANGYDELIDAKELENRFSKTNQQRVSSGKRILPLDRELIDSIEEIPDCCGVAVGFDRLMMLRQKSGCIHNSMALID